MFVNSLYLKNNARGFLRSVSESRSEDPLPEQTKYHEVVVK